MGDVTRLDELKEVIVRLAKIWLLVILGVVCMLTMVAGTGLVIYGIIEPLTLFWRSVAVGGGIGVIAAALIGVVACGDTLLR